jgi:P-type Cu+ transporter
MKDPRTRFPGKQVAVCYHCGEFCTEEEVSFNEKHFCCQGCKTVYEILNESGLCEYYDIEKNPGLAQKIKVREGKFSLLDNDAVAAKLIHFSDGVQKHVTFYLPQMHCSSCIWLLEQLSKLDKGIISSRVNFLKKEVTVIYNNSTSLRKIAELLTRIGYEPHISLKNLENKKIKKYDRSRIYKIGVAGFCFGNIMLLSFPEYFSSGDIEETKLKTLFNVLNLVLALPVFFYCASDFFISAWKSLRQKFLNIDAPIALAILITFSRSIYEIISGTGPGYLDSMSGIVFFMLLGRFFQDRTYQALNFERDYTSYFPIGVTVANDEGKEIQKSVSDIVEGDMIKVHSHEIVPADAILLKGKANIDYSFVTGESLPCEKTIGEIIYAGGKQMGGAIELKVVKSVSQSYLTQLWNNKVFKKKRIEKRLSFVHEVSRYFTYVLFSIAIFTAVYWLVVDHERLWSAVTAILIVACPCALLLSATFTNGNMLSKLSGRGFYLRNATVLEGISSANTIVFDKTGTLSVQNEAKIEFFEGALSEYEQQLVRTLCSQSNHPLSRVISQHLPFQKQFVVKEYVETKGKGSSGIIDGHLVKIGSASFIGNIKNNNYTDSRVYVSINEEVLGFFSIRTEYRNGLRELVQSLKEDYNLMVISGDNDAEKQKLLELFGNKANILFNQSPQKKLEIVQTLQGSGCKVIMIGDGLNDAGALEQSDVGIAVSDDINNFSPGCDAILEGRSFSSLKKLFDYCKKEKPIIYGSFIISIAYNLVGLSYAVQGTLSPLIAAILMPVSSASIILYTTLMSSWFSRKLDNRNK